MSLVDDGLLEGSIRVLDQLTMDITGHRNRSLVLAHRRELRVDRVHGQLPPPCLLHENCPRVLVLNEGAQRASARTAESGEFFETPGHIWAVRTGE